VIDAALYGAALRVLEWTIAAYDQLGVIRNREGNRLANSAPLDNYPTADGKYVCIVAGSDANFGRLCRAMDQTELVDDFRFARLADRAERSDEINGIVAKWTASHTAVELEAACVAHDVPVATAYTSADMFADPHFAARGDLMTIADPVAGPMRQQAPYPRFVGEPQEAPTGAPRLGEHTDDVLATLIGLEPSELASLRERGIV
jgi:crotonobetainyl-CoA:carnitine CoA-transferase CaiB-like acyl-CoA transferase